VHIRVGNVVSCVARPKVVSDQGDVAFCAYSLSCEAAFCSLQERLVEEVVPEDAFIVSESCDFVRRLARLEVGVALNSNCVINRKSSKSIVSVHFMHIGQFE